MLTPFHYLVRCFLLIGLIVFGLTPVSAKETSPRFTTLEQYIDHSCPKGCVDDDLLMMAVEQAAEETKIDPNVLLAIIRVESSFQTKAINRVSGRSVGLTQVQVRWHKRRFSSADYYDVMDNVHVGAEIYKTCATRWKGSREKALWCYNGHQKKGMKLYVTKVMKAYHEIRHLNLTFT